MPYTHPGVHFMRATQRQRVCHRLPTVINFAGFIVLVRLGMLG